MRVDLQQIALIARASAAPERSHAAAPRPATPAASSAPEQAASVVQEIPQRSINFRMGENKRVYFVVVDDRTGDVVREVPPEEMRRAGQQIGRYLEKEQAAHRSSVNIIA